MLKGKAVSVSPSTFSFNQLVVLFDPEDDEPTNDDDLRRPFEQFGTITQTRFYTYKPLECYFYVTFEDHQGAAKAATALRNELIPGMDPFTEKLVDPHVPNIVVPEVERQVPNEVQTFQGINVRVTNLVSTVTDWYLHRLFSHYGTVTSSKVGLFLASFILYMCSFVLFFVF